MANSDSSGCDLPSASSERCGSKDSDSVKKFRLAGKVFFLTWPQNDSLKEAVLDRVVALWGDDIGFGGGR